MTHDTRPTGPLQALTGPALRARRSAQVQGLSRRVLLRRALAAGIGLTALEALGGTIAFAWSAVGRAGPRVRVGTLADLAALNPGLPVLDGFPVYVQEARAFVTVVDP